MRALVVLLALATTLTTALPAQVDLFFVTPQQTDGAISAGEPHIVATNAGAIRAPLVVFLPGTGAVPSQYQMLARSLALGGIAVASLNYPNPLAVNTVCAVVVDLDCYEQVRGEILTGENTSPLVAVSRADSIENRLLRLLQFLHRLAPARGWDQFFSGERLLWHRLVLSGHSQGGGHAGFIAKRYRTARAVMLAAMDYNILRQRVAPWMEQPGATPAASYFAFGHERDELVGYTALSEIAWPALGLDRFAGPLPISNDNYGSARTLRMDNMGVFGTAHSFVAGDTVSLLNATARQNVERAWRHLHAGASAIAVNAASYQGAAVASGSLAAIYAEGVRAGRTYDLWLEGRAARIFATANNQVNAILPDLPAGVAAVELAERGTANLWSGVLEVRATAPGIFTSDFSGAGEAAALWTGNVLTLFGTGWRGSRDIRVTLAGRPLEVQFAGAQPEFAGLDQINVIVPGTFSGRRDVDLRLEAGGMAANAVRVSIPVFP
jgi:uncharacterized protein (TIGR03437 family)